MEHLLKLAEEFEGQISKLAGGKTKLNRKQMIKLLEKAKAKYKSLKDGLDVMEADDAKLKGKLDQTRQHLDHERKSILQMHKALQHMDLSDTNDATFYDDGDVSYLMNGKEYHIEMGEDGNLQLTPMGKYRKSKKKDSGESEPVCDENCTDDSHEHAAKEEETHEEEEKPLEDPEIIELLNSEFGM